MNEKDDKAVTIDDFNIICRVCLQSGENMIDIFMSGIESHLMEVTSLKVKIDDQLPRTLCQKCCSRIYQYFTFLQLAKSSDNFLRSLLPTASNYADVTTKVTEDYIKEEKKYSRKKHEKSHRQLKQIKIDEESDNIYIIVVPESSGGETEVDNKICIKDINTESENLELINYCRTLVRSHYLDHTYPKDKKSSSDVKPNCSLVFKHKNETLMVNLHVYECKDCKVAYEDIDDFVTHFSYHNIEPPELENNFICPACGFSVKEKSIFLSHLRDHKKEGYLFVKVNALGAIMPLKENEKDLFVESLKKCLRIFMLCLNSLKCTVCYQNIQSVENILDHLESCLCEEKSIIRFNLKYMCPICSKTFIDKEKNFIEHLASHKEDNYYFIKGDITGKPAPVAKEEKLFVSFEDAKKVFDASATESRIFEIANVNSCDKCDYSSECFSDLLEHKSSIHFENMSDEILFCCPVCQIEFKSLSVDEKLDKFYEHLKVHKNEGVSFVLVKKNGTLSNCTEKYSDIFTQSLFLLMIMKSSGLELEYISPELVILDVKNSSSGKYTCDFCQKQFKNKHKIIVHLKSHQRQEIIKDCSGYICEKCGKRCSGKAGYKKHFLKHSKALSSICRRPICAICNKKFANKVTFDSHMRHHLEEETGNEFCRSLPGIICEKCGRSFSNNASLTKHKKMHLKEKENTVFKCEICFRDFFRQTSFDRHKSAHLNPKYFECGTCMLPLPSVASLQKHSEIHKNGSNTFDCKVCELSFLTKDSLTAHQTHTGHHLDRKPLECNVCHEKFFIGKKFSQHIKTHPKYKVGECTLCGKRLSTIRSLMLHMERHFESNTVLCPHCGKQFFDDKNYTRHLLTHEGIKPFPCDLEGCKKSFYTLFELNRHKKYHNNTRDFSCMYCSKSFHESSHLTVHIRTHTGERPYTCPHCNKSFVTRTRCKHHIKLVHQGVGYDLIRSNISKKVTVFEAVKGIP